MATTFAVPRSTLLSAPRYDAFTSIGDVHALLVRAGLPVAPTVVARLAVACNGDPAAVVEIAQRLNHAQRRGLRALPDPLPLVPSIAERFSSAKFDDVDRQILIAASVCIDDRLEVLLAVAGLDAAQLIASGASSVLAFVAGRFMFSVPEARIWAHETASLSERTAVHASLAAIYERMGEESFAVWHRSLSAVQGDPRLAGALLGQSRRLLNEGSAEQAYAVAREAASHADRDLLPFARAAAGHAALSGGWLDDALDWLEPAFRDGDMTVREWALPAYVIAATVRRGAVPLVEMERFRAGISDTSQWGVYARAAGIAAMLCAERGLRGESREWLAITREADGWAGAAGTIRTSAEAWTALVSGEAVDVPDALHETVSPICRALRAGVSGDLDGGLRLLSGVAGARGIPDDNDALFVGFGRAPIVRAYQAVARVLLYVWAGDLRTARENLINDGYALPLALPFAGLGVALARRIEVSVDGRGGALSESMGVTLASNGVLDRLMERAMEAYLSGDIDEAAAHVQLWGERASTPRCFGSITLDEAGPLDQRRESEPPEVRLAHTLRVRIRSVRDNIGFSEYERIVEEARSIRSPFDRGRIEALLGAMCVSRGDLPTGLRHLRAGEALLAESGADVWRRAVEVRLARLGEQLAERVQVPTMPISVVSSADPLAHCRAAWEPILTARELSVAMLVAEGRTNREIAERLTVSVRTVEVHIGRLFTKLGVRGRGELTALAHRTNQHI